MGKIKYILAGYMHKFRGEKHQNKYRLEKNCYLLVCKKGRHLDYGGWLETSRELHSFLEFDTKQQALDYLDNDVAKSERKDWAMYKRYESIPKATRPTKE